MCELNENKNSYFRRNPQDNAKESSLTFLVLNKTKIQKNDKNMKTKSKAFKNMKSFKSTHSTKYQFSSQLQAGHL